MKFSLAPLALATLAASASAQFQAPGPSSEQCADFWLHQMEYHECVFCQMQYECTLVTCGYDPDCLFDAAVTHLACVYTYDCGGFSMAATLAPLVDRGVIGADAAEVLATLAEWGMEPATVLEIARGMGGGEP